MFILPAWIENDGNFNETSKIYTGEFLHLLFADTISSKAFKPNFTTNREGSFRPSKNECYFANYVMTLSHWFNFDNSGFYRTKRNDWLFRPNHFPTIRDQNYGRNVDGVKKVNIDFINKKSNLIFTNRNICWDNNIIFNYGDNPYFKWLGYFLEAYQKGVESIFGDRDTPSYDVFYDSYKKSNILFNELPFAQTYTQNMFRFRKTMEVMNLSLFFHEQKDLSTGIRGYVDNFIIINEYSENMRGSFLSNTRQISN